MAVDSFGPEDVSGHGFIRAAKLLKMNNSALPKELAQKSPINGRSAQQSNSI